MARRPNLTPLKAILKGQPRNVAIEAVYQLGHILSHRFSWDEFVARTGTGNKMPYQTEALDWVRDMVAVIERTEGAPVPDLPKDVRVAYGRCLNGLIPPDTSPRLVRQEDVDAFFREARLAS